MNRVTKTRSPPLRANPIKLTAPETPYHISTFHLDKKIRTISLLHMPEIAVARRHHFASQILALAHHEYQELWTLLHLTQEGAPFAGHEGMKRQVEVAKEGLMMALEKWRILAREE
jgi:hypothetical protein